jgi:hypothetical protein
MEDRAFYYCYEPLQLIRSTNATDPLIKPDGNSQIVERSFSPNRLEFKVLVGAKESRVSLNQNWSPGWTNTAGPFAALGDRMPAVILTPGQTGTYAFEFFPEGLVTGCVIFLAALIISPVLWTRSLPHRPSATR